MSREIKFRGKRVDNGEWIYGSLINNTFQTNDGKILMYIIDDDMEYDCWEHIAEQLEDYEVIPESVGQYTGMKESRNLIGEYDKKDIYEGDIIQEDGWDDLYLVKYDDYKFIAKKLGRGNGDIFTRHNKDLDNILWAVIVGNKTDNPELLKN
jgi:hypothetical protein